MTLNTGLYTLNEFTDRLVTKLAPDAFVTFMGSTGIRISLGPLDSSFDMKAGLTSLNISASIVPGAGTCTMDYVCPQYDSLNTSYYVTQPNGVKEKFFQTMMEVRVYAKARFMKRVKGQEELMPVYHPVFWGYIASINETYQGSETSFSINCVDLLKWWENIRDNNVAVDPTATVFGGGQIVAAGNLYKKMNPWMIILNLFKETTFANFVYPSPIAKEGATIGPLDVKTYITSMGGSEGDYGTYRTAIINDWQNRYSMGRVLSANEQSLSGVANLEMFGVSKVMRISDKNASPVTLVERKDSFDQSADKKDPQRRFSNDSDNLKKLDPVLNDADKGTVKSNDLGAAGGGDYVFALVNTANSRDTIADLDFGLFKYVLPFGQMGDTQGTFSPDAAAFNKLQVAQQAAETINFEFYQDTNGCFVFKPPFYNMDVSRNALYTITAREIISFSESEDSTVIKNYVYVTGHMLQEAEVTVQGWHVDFGLVRKYGIREASIKLGYGGDSKTVRAMAASEMAKNNAMAYTAVCSIPFRPELRLGYPVYVDMIDAYYYVKQISHSFTFGGTATTTLTLEAKRAKVYDNDGTVMKGYIYKASANASGTPTTETPDAATLDAQKKQLDAKFKDSSLGGLDTTTPILKKEEATGLPPNTYYVKSLSPKAKYLKANNMISSPAPGFYSPVKSEAFAALEKTGAGTDAISKVKQKIMDGELSELVMYTEETHPYTDINGYYHIGAFPYGAALALKEDGTINETDSVTIADMASDINVIAPYGRAAATDKTGLNSGEEDTAPASTDTKPVASPDAVKQAVMEPIRPVSARGMLAASTFDIKPTGGGGLSSASSAQNSSSSDGTQYWTQSSDVDQSSASSSTQVP